MAGAVHPRPMSPCTAPILVLTRSFVRSTGLPMPKVNGIGRSKKRKKLAPVAPTEPMPDKEGELIEDEKGCGRGARIRKRAVPETTSLFALLWRTRMIWHAHAASHVPSDMAGEHDTSTPVLVQPRGRAPTSESGVREHTPHFRCSSRTTRTRTKN